MEIRPEIRELLDRLSRTGAPSEADDGLNPAQRAALAYLARANRFSRSPSQVADYLFATRGTTSQTLKALARKGYVDEVRSAEDRRRVSFTVTPAGRTALSTTTSLDVGLAALDDDDAEHLAVSMRRLLQEILDRRGGRPFGICASCRHHQKAGAGARCGLLQVDLAPAETGLICHEHQF